MNDALDYDKIMRDVGRLYANAKNGTLKVNGVKYVLTFNAYQGVYDVTDHNGQHIVSLNTRKISVARKWLREELGE